MKYFWQHLVLLCSIAGSIHAKSSVYFAPDDDPRTELIALIDDAQESILVAVYTFTEQLLAKALIRAHERGVQVEVVLDTYSESKWGKVKMLQKAGIPVHIYAPKPRNSEKYVGIMHDKYAVFDNTKVWTGSYNWTFSANFRNQENALLIEDEPKISARFAQQFEVLKERCEAGCGHKNIPAHNQETLVSTLMYLWDWGKSKLHYYNPFLATAHTS